MPALGRYGGMVLSPNIAALNLGVNAVAAFDMAALNKCWAARFTARDTRDVKSVWINWQTVTAAGVVQARIETIDPTTGKPTGSLYDAAAFKSFTPVAGWQNVIFNTLPTAGLVAGTEYALLLLTTTGGTAHSLISHPSATAFLAHYPSVVLNATDGTTRSNLAEVIASVPIATLVYEDDIEEAGDFAPYAVRPTLQIFGTNAYGAKFTSFSSLSVAGVTVYGLTKNGAPGDFRVRIFGSANALVATRTIDKDSLAGGTASARAEYVLFPVPVTLTAGVYRVILDQTDHSTTSGNRYNLIAVTGRSTAVIPSGLVRTETANIDAGTIAWTDTPGDLPMIGLILDDIVPAGGLMLPLGYEGGI